MRLINSRFTYLLWDILYLFVVSCTIHIWKSKGIVNQLKCFVCWK